ncbi:MAG: MoxR family ATPase [Candidatus Hydrothermae bacterium]|nr:MoxR family ATPase [Candidatus Hydrothermae bacterium]
MDEKKILELTQDILERLYKEFSQRIMGQREVIEQILIALFSQGHVLLMGLPGLAKTLMVKTLAEILDLAFSRIQFTPDLMPSDITGSDILEEDPSTGKKYFKFIEGPIFANIILADEINRTPPKTQSALLEAMQELRVTVSGKTYRLEKPFFVVATQNPIEQEGTYPLPEALLDRFMMEVRIDYPSRKEELEIVESTTGPDSANLTKLLTKDEIMEIQKIVREVPAPSHVIEYAVDLVRKTRPVEKESPDFIKEYVIYGASPRASQSLILGSKARAILRGHVIPTTQDVKALAASVLRHRIIKSFKAEVDGVNIDEIIKSLL